MRQRTLNFARAAALCVVVVSGSVVATALAQSSSSHREGEATITVLPSLTKTIANEPLSYPNTSEPIVSSAIVTIPPGAVTEWMTHPVPAYLYVLEGKLTVELADGTRQEFKAGDAFLQCRTTWHRGRNEGTSPMRFLAVFVGAKDVPTILHPPSGPAVHAED
jgi:quercetin dioxygenase-like cupin family protein